MTFLLFLDHNAFKKGMRDFKQCIEREEIIFNVEVKDPGAPVDFFINGEPVDNPKLALIELICIAYFTVEFLLRLAGAPKKIAFLKSTMNIVDVAAILSDRSSRICGGSRDVMIRST